MNEINADWNVAVEHDQQLIVESPDSQVWSWAQIIDQDENIVALVTINQFTETQVLCDRSQLIASAPALLKICIEASQFIVPLSDYDVPLCLKDRLKAVIEKATGMTYDDVTNEE